MGAQELSVVMPIATGANNTHLPHVLYDDTHTMQLLVTAASTLLLTCLETIMTVHEGLDQHGAQLCHFHVCLGMSKGWICARQTHTHCAICTHTVLHAHTL